MYSTPPTAQTTGAIESLFWRDVHQADINGATVAIFLISISDWRYWLFADFSKSPNFGHFELIFWGSRRKFENRHGGAIYIHPMYPLPKN